MRDPNGRAYKGAKTHKVSSKNIASMFQAVVEAYQEAEDIEPAARLTCEAEHVDGGMNASEKEAKLDWLKADAPEGTCRVLSNVRCLSEGVDVPALDAVLFLTPRNSQVDVVQSVGRVMRKAEGKKRGYVILPVVIPAGVEPHDALNDNKTYAVVWQVLQALRSHDDRFDAMVNKLDLIGKDPRKMEVIAITDKVQRKPAHAKAGTSNSKAGRGQFGIGEAAPQYGEKGTAPLPFEIGEIERAIYAKVVQKCGNRHHWEDWANDIAKIARTHIDRITAIIEHPGHAKERAEFEAFAEELRDDLNDSIRDGEIIEMLAQHLITKPVFDALFAGYSFAQHNPMSQAMQGVLDALQEHRLDKEADTLERFYASVRQRAEGIDNAAGKQKIVVELYDKFFRNAFVTNAGWLDANTTDGLRKTLAEEFSSIYVFHLRGNQRTSGELSRKEGGKIFGSGSRAPIAISLLVKNSKATEHGRIYFHDIGDYLSREDKLEKITAYGSVAGIADANQWTTIQPDAHGDWLSQRDQGFAEFISLGNKKSDGPRLFENYSNGVKTNRDAWAYNACKAAVFANMDRMIAFYNDEVDRFSSGNFSHLSSSEREDAANRFIDTDPRKISWDHAQKIGVARGRRAESSCAAIRQSLYRPFTKQWLYFDHFFNNRVYQMPRIFPDAAAENRVICVSGTGARSFSTLITDTLPCLDNIEKGQCFPLYLYDEANGVETPSDMFAALPAPSHKAGNRSALTDAGLAHFRTAYPGEAISKEDIFYYVYGLLHSPDYRTRYADNLAKELPRIPCVKTGADFWAFSRAGRALAELHLGYETVAPYPVKIDTGGKRLTDADYRVDKMRYGKQGKEKDLTTLHYNDTITLTGIPLEAYDYVVNGKPALDWVVERQCVKTDKASGIVNDANDWAIETMGNPKYPLELFQRVITVSLETLKIVKALPTLDI